MEPKLQKHIGVKKLYSGQEPSSPSNKQYNNKTTSEMISGHGKRDKRSQRTWKKGAKCLCKVIHDNIQGFTKPALHHLACRADVKCILDLIYEETHGVFKV